MKKKFRIIITISIFSLLFYNFTIADEIRTRFGFYIDLPENFVAIQDQNIGKLMNETDNDLNKEFFNDMMAGSSKQDLNIEFYYPKNLKAEYNSININVQREGNLREIRRDFSLNEICGYYQQMFSELFKKQIRQYECKYNNNFKPKYPDVLRTKHDASQNGNFMFQYQFDYRNNLVTLTIGCEPINCRYMEDAGIQMIRSIN